ncbi:hypothetical protein [Trichormus azollae]|nr:hypothetical protein [Trichormus azollae]
MLENFKHILHHYKGRTLEVILYSLNIFFERYRICS